MTAPPPPLRVRVEVLDEPAPFEVDVVFVSGRRNALVARDAPSALLKAVDRGRETPLGIDCMLVTEEGVGVAVCGAPSRLRFDTSGDRTVWMDVTFVHDPHASRGPWERLIARARRSVTA
jgi:hypothetical protein